MDENPLDQALNEISEAVNAAINAPPPELTAALERYNTILIALLTRTMTMGQLNMLGILVNNLQQQCDAMQTQIRGHG